MEELIFNVSDTHFFFNDLEVSVILRLFCFGNCIMSGLAGVLSKDGIEWDLKSHDYDNEQHQGKVN